MGYHGYSKEVRTGPLVASVASFVIFFLVVPALLSAGLIPIALLPVGRWIYIASALVVCSLVAGIGQSPTKRWSVVRTSGLTLASIVLIVAGAGMLLDALLGDFSVTTAVERVESPDGRMVLAYDYSDQGALGHADIVVVRARLVPGLVEWRYSPFFSDDSVSAVGWVDRSTIYVNEGSYRIPGVMDALAW